MEFTPTAVSSSDIDDDSSQGITLLRMCLVSAIPQINQKRISRLLLLLRESRMKTAIISLNPGSNFRASQQVRM